MNPKVNEDSNGSSMDQSIKKQESDNSSELRDLQLALGKIPTGYQKGSGRTLNIPKYLPTDTIPGPSYNSAESIGEPCIGNHCAIPITPDSKSYVSMLSNMSETPCGIENQTPSIERLGNNTITSEASSLGDPYNIQCAGGYFDKKNMLINNKMSKYITDPISQRRYNIGSAEGQYVLNNYKNHIGGFFFKSDPDTSSSDSDSKSESHADKLKRGLSSMYHKSKDALSKGKDKAKEKASQLHQQHKDRQQAKAEDKKRLEAWHVKEDYDNRFASQNYELLEHYLNNINKHSDNEEVQNAIIRDGCRTALMILGTAEGSSKIDKKYRCDAPLNTAKKVANLQLKNIEEEEKIYGSNSPFQDTIKKIVTSQNVISELKGATSVDSREEEGNDSSNNDSSGSDNNDKKENKPETSADSSDSSSDSESDSSK